MADIRINSLPTTASASSSNDFLAIDGATNGTRKLSAYSPTFGGAVTINGNGTYGAIQLPSGTTSIYGVAFGTDTNLWRTDSGNLELGGSSVALIGLNVGGTNKGYFYNNGTDTTLAGAGTLTFKSNGTTTGLTLDSSNATVAGNLTVNGTGTSSFGGDLTFPTNKGIYSAVQNGRLYLSGDSAGAGAFVQLTGSSFSTPNHIRIDANTGTISNLANTKNSTWDSNQNWAIAGNLTVSGTGTSSVAGSLGIGTTSPTRPLDVRGSLGMQVNEDNAGTKVISIRSDFASSGPAINVTTNDPLIFLTNNSERARITSGGNVLIGTTTDGGQKLQVSGTGYFSGNVGIGANAANRSLEIHNASTPAVVLRNTGQGTDQKSWEFSVSGNVLRGAIENDAFNTEKFWLEVTRSSSSLSFDSVKLNTGAGTTALTLDSSQNATFAALVKTKLAFEAYDGATADRWQLYTYTDKTFRWNYNGSGSDELSIDTSGNLIVAGSMRTGTPIGGTASAWKFGKYNTTAPSATGYVEVDIGGTLYKLLAST